MKEEEEEEEEEEKKFVMLDIKILPASNKKKRDCEMKEDRIIMPDVSLYCLKCVVTIRYGSCKITIKRKYDESFVYTYTCMYIYIYLYMYICINSCTPPKKDLVRPRGGKRKKTNKKKKKKKT